MQVILAEMVPNAKKNELRTIGGEYYTSLDRIHTPVEWKYGDKGLCIHSVDHRRPPVSLLRGNLESSLKQLSLMSA